MKKHVGGDPCLSREALLLLHGPAWASPQEVKKELRREHDARDRRVWRVHLTDEVEPALRTMRTIAAELRRDALTGISAAERERFVDTLLAIKENLR